MNEDQFKSLLEIVEKSKSTIDRLEQNWDKDRIDFNEFGNRLGHLEQEVKSLKDAVLKLPERTKNKVSDAVEGVAQATVDLKEEIQTKKIILMNPIKRRWYKNLFRRKNGNTNK